MILVTVKQVSIESLAQVARLSINDNDEVWNWFQV